MIDINTERLESLKKIGFAPRFILDVGAFWGDWSMLAAHTWPSSKIYLVEANRDCEVFLKSKNLGEYECALLWRDGGVEKNYFASKKEITTGNSIYPEQTWYFADAEVRKMATETLTNLCMRRGWPDFDFIKIDTQGSELDIIEGGLGVIDRAEFVQIETQILEYNFGAPMMIDVIKRMDELGFQVFDFTELHHLLSEELFQVDILFAKKTSRFIKKGMLWEKK